MTMDRRTFILGSAAAVAATTPTQADDRRAYREYHYVDYFSLDARGTYPSDPADLERANIIAASLPTINPLMIMQALAAINEVGSTGEPFNARWRKFANPLLVRFFHDIGYHKTPYPGDCTPWCAATVSWCLKRAGQPIPSDPASSQSFLGYGKRVTEPEPGDLCVFTTIGDTAHGHVGMYLRSTDDTVSVLGGNQTGRSTTNCGPGYRQSRITQAEYPINRARKRSVSIHYLAAYVRPT